MKSRLFIWGNVALGVAILAYVMRAYGWRAIAILGRDVSLPWFVAFALAAAATIVCLAGRWQYVIRGLTQPPGLPILTFYRSASHSLAVLMSNPELRCQLLDVLLVTS